MLLDLLAAAAIMEPSQLIFVVGVAVITDVVAVVDTIGMVTVMDRLSASAGLQTFARAFALMQEHL